MQTYVHFYLRSKNGSPPPPPGFMDFAEELEGIANAFKRVVVYNHSIFTDYFNQVLKKEIAQTEGAAGGSASGGGAIGGGGATAIAGLVRPSKPTPNITNN